MVLHHLNVFCEFLLDLLWLRRQLNLRLYKVEELFGHEFLFRQGVKLLLRLDVLSLEHGFIHAIKLSIMDHVKRLFSRFSFPSLREQFSDNKVYCLILHLSFSVQFLLQALLIPAKLHFGGFIPLAERCCDIRIIRIWVFPEFPSESFSFLPVRQKMDCEELLADFLHECFVFQIEKVCQQFGVCLALCFLVNFFHAVNEPLELLLRQRLLLDGLPSHIGANCAVALCDLGVEVSQELLVTLNKLVVIVSKVKCECIRKYGRHILEEVRHCGHMLHRLVLKFHIDDGHRERVLLFPRRLILVHRLLDGLDGIKGRMTARRACRHCRRDVSWRASWIGGAISGRFLTLRFF